MPKINTDYSYELVEMYKGKTPIMTLQNYNAEHKKNAIIGIVILPIISVAFLAGAVYYLTVYLKRK